MGIDAANDSNVNDNTIEAAIRLVSKVGLTLDQRIGAEKDAERRAKLVRNNDALFERLTQLETMKEDDPKNRASLRIKILIKNMFDNKQSGWAKSKEEKKIQKKQEVENQVLKQDAEKRKSDIGSGRGDDRRDRDYDDRNRRGGKYDDRKGGDQRVSGKQETQKYQAKN